MRRNNIWVRIFAIIALIAFLGVSVLTIVPMNVGAKSAESQLKDAQKKQSELKDKIKDTKTKISANSKEKKALDSEIAKVQTEIDKLNSKISESNNKIAAKEQELAVAQQQSQTQYGNYYARAKMMVEKGSVMYLEVLLNSKSFSDLLSRYSVVKQIVRYDSNRLDELKAVESKIAELKKELEGEKANLVALRSNETAQMNALASKRAASQKIIDDLQSDQASYEKALKQQEQAEANARAEIARLAAQSNASVASLPKIGSGGMIKPASGPVTSPYGVRIHPVTGKRKQHTGIDYGAPHGSSILAAAAGTVIVSGYNSGGYGNYVVINHGNGVTSLYAHASALLVSKGQQVTQGQPIARVGSTGMSTGPHLHFEVLINGSHTNPAAYLP